MKYLNIAFYQFTELSSLPELRALLKETCARLELRGTILLAPEGINGSVAGEELRIREFQDYLSRRIELQGLQFKESLSSQKPFGRMKVKLKKEIIPIGDERISPLKQTGKRIAPKELKKWLDENKDFVLIDTRNDYEIELGTFKNAVDLGLKHFRGIKERLKEVPESIRSKPVVMFCTGGIRCEKATALAMEQGFRDVYQLDGGILKYFEECGDSHYQGKCFVFDERVALDGELSEKAEP
jgi:UPF0176 protein